jgi:hypothetical protein
LGIDVSIERVYGPPWIRSEPPQPLNFSFDADPYAFFYFSLCRGSYPISQNDADLEPQHFIGIEVFAFEQWESGNTVYLQYGIISHLFGTLCIGN